MRFQVPCAQPIAIGAKCQEQEYKAPGPHGSKAENDSMGMVPLLVNEMLGNHEATKFAAAHAIQRVRWLTLCFLSLRLHRLQNSWRNWPALISPKCSLCAAFEWKLARLPSEKPSSNCWMDVFIQSHYPGYWKTAFLLCRRCTAWRRLPGSCKCSFCRCSEQRAPWPSSCVVLR